jgi:hypothetical protein
MAGMDAKTSVTWKVEGTLRGPDGYVCEFSADDSFRSWRSIVRWNLHYRHWRPLAGNARDLFSKVIWRSVWRRS